ncbi:response regulator [Paenibacillus andongensis]|uniref:response regulator n=1 Tax=Paenibacillus andongensis TaxID=2975482 RepID=UPI0021BAC399|nr:response regulator [Paenibacillus andongensis]
MYNLLIVDDEKEIREGLSAIPWPTMRVNLMGSAKHGLDALKFISEHPIDIVLTDIRMPFMDGIELLNTLARQHPYIRVVILSGHSDFGYAQQAVANGAFDYLLKPTQFDVLLKTFERLVRKLDEEKQEELRKSALLRKEKLLSKRLREEFLSELFKCGMSVEDIELGCSESEIILDGPDYTVAAVRLDRISLNKQVLPDRELKLITFSLDNILCDMWDANGKAYHLVNKENAEVCLLSMKASPKSDFIQLKQQLSSFRGLFKSTLSIGIGKSARHATDIWRSARSAKQLLDNTEEEDSARVYTEALQHEAPGHATSEPLTSAIHIKDNKKDRTIVHEAKQFIKQNFHQSITLKQIANEVHVTPGHLSALFRESGETYIQYLTTMRVNKAIELLGDIRYKIYEIAESVGYSDHTYFSEIFKKYMGKTPTEYREASDRTEGRIQP